MAVICELLGLPDGDREKFSRWFRGFAEIKSILSFPKLLPGISKLLKYLEEQFEVVRKNPRPGLISELVAVESDGDRLSKNELLSMVFILLMAGHETTVHLINVGMYLLLKNPGQLDILKHDWGHISSTVDEVLRYGSIVTIAKPRMVVDDHDFHDVHLKRADLIIPILGAANFDPAKFTNPEQFDVRRSPNPHLTFGSGIHICLGLKLAKVETEIAYRSLFDRFPEMTFASERENVVWRKRIGLRSIGKFRVRLNG